MSPGSDINLPPTMLTKFTIIYDKTRPQESILWTKKPIRGTPK